MTLAEHVRMVPPTDIGTLVGEVATKQASAPTAIFAANDRVAVEVLGQAIDVGLAVPDDLSIVGYDNATSARLVRPQLTTVDQPRQQMGRDAMQHLAELIGGKGRPRHTVLQPTLIVCDSTAPPKE